MTGEKVKKFTYVVLFFGGIGLIILVLLYFESGSSALKENTIIAPSPSANNSEVEEVPSLSNLFDPQFSKDSNPLSSNSSNLPGQVPLKQKVYSQSGKNTCEIYGQTIPEGVVIYDTTCTPSLKD
jgi:hypothetical protein